MGPHPPSPDRPLGAEHREEGSKICSPTALRGRAAFRGRIIDINAKVSPSKRNTVVLPAMPDKSEAL